MKEFLEAVEKFRKLLGEDYRCSVGDNIDTSPAEAALRTAYERLPEHEKLSAFKQAVIILIDHTRDDRFNTVLMRETERVIFEL